MKATKAHLRWLSRHAQRGENGSWICTRTGRKMNVEAVRRRVLGPGSRIREEPISYFVCSCKSEPASVRQGTLVFAYQLEEGE